MRLNSRLARPERASFIDRARHRAVSKNERWIALLLHLRRPNSKKMRNGGVDSLFKARNVARVY